MNATLFQAVLDHDELADLSVDDRRHALAELVAMHGGTSFDLKRLVDRIDGYGPLTTLMEDDSITDILVDGPERVWVDRKGELEPAGVTFDDDELVHLIHRLVGEANVRVDVSQPLADARLPDGSRLHVALPPVTEYPVLSIRRFPRRPLVLEDLLALGTITTDEASRLVDHVLQRRSILVSGATGSGKTTMLSALLGRVLHGERVVTLEETRELRVDHPNVVSLVGRTANVEGAGSVTLSDLVRASLRMRPDRIVIGEVRGAEAWDALSAMSTGHAGSMMTIHAPDAERAVTRFAALANAAPGSAPYEIVAEQVAASIDVVVYLARCGSVRRVVEIVER